jgi:hypothetical protein
MAKKLSVRSVTGENQFTDPTELMGYFNVSISGTWDGAVTAQRSFDSGSTWFDVNQWTDNVQEYGFEPELGVYYRIGVKAGDYGSGTPVLRISQ